MKACQCADERTYYDEKGERCRKCGGYVRMVKNGRLT